MNVTCQVYFDGKNKTKGSNVVKHTDIGHSVAPVETLDLLGGRLCLNFVNTMDPRIGEHPREFLNTYTDLVAWSKHVGMLTQEQSNILLQEAQNRVEETDQVFNDAILLRESLYNVFVALITNEEPQRTAMERVQHTFANAMMHATLSLSHQHFTWEWIKAQGSLDSIVWPIASSAMDVLTSEEWKRVKQCPGVGDCGWLFLDTSKNGSRQWCSMQECGSRAKMRRQYARKRSERV